MYYDIICMNKQISKVIFINYYQRLRDLREDMELNQSMIAKILDTSQKQYSRWETGEYPIPFEKVIQLAKFYKVSIDYIAGLTNDKRGIGYKADSNSKYNITQQNNNSAVIKMFGLDKTLAYILIGRIIIDALIFLLIIYLICKFLDLCKTVNDLSKRSREQTELLKQQNETLVKIGQIIIKINQDKEG